MQVIRNTMIASFLIPLDLPQVSVAAANMLVIVQMAVAVGNIWAHYASLRAQHRQDLLRAANVSCAHAGP
jgi:hypothetical protein